MMVLNIDAQFEGKLSCGFKNYMRNLANFHQSTFKNLKIGTLMGFFYPKQKINQLNIYRGVTILWVDKAKACRQKVGGRRSRLGDEMLSPRSGIQLHKLRIITPRWLSLKNFASNLDAQTQYACLSKGTLQTLETFYPRKRCLCKETFTEMKKKRKIQTGKNVQESLNLLIQINEVHARSFLVTTILHREH